MRETLGLGNTNGNSSKENGSTSMPREEKKALDISHLIKRKRKPEDDGNTDDCSAAKKPAN